VNFAADVTGRKWVIMADKRKNYNPPPSCPFCPQAIDSHKILLAKNGVTVIANDSPRLEWDEVIVHSPDHLKDFDELPIEQVANTLTVLRDRFNYHKNHGRVFIFQNHDLYAGASIPHPHSQLIVVPMIIPVEPSPREPIANIILQTENFTAYCPEFSQWPYEVWITPDSTSDFGSTDDRQINNLALILQKILKAMVQKFEIKKEMAKKGIGKEFPYNFYIYHGQNWYLRIIPRLTRHGGFELASGLHVNTIIPSRAATEFHQEIQKL
jgi:UDPglucose--hexose-1-phosphate uridylyltransferase